MNISQMNSIQHVFCVDHGKNGNTVQRKPMRFFAKHTHAIALTLVVVMTFAPTAKAELPHGMEVFEGMTEISDGELGEMRGKFAGNNTVMYFGVDIATQWQTPTGDLIKANANLNIDFRNNHGATPTVQYVPTITIVQGQNAPPAPGNSGGNVSGGAGLNNISGVSQNIQVAGISNQIRNDINMQVDMLTDNTGGGSTGPIMQNNAGSVSQTAPDGTTATISLAHNDISISVVVPGQGQSMQQIRDQGMLQSVRIGGDLNLIHNQIAMNIGLGTASGMNNPSLSAVFQQLKMLPQ